LLGLRWGILKARLAGSTHSAVSSGSSPWPRQYAASYGTDQLEKGQPENTGRPCHTVRRRRIDRYPGVFALHNGSSAGHIVVKFYTSGLPDLACQGKSLFLPDTVGVAQMVLHNARIPGSRNFLQRGHHENLQDENLQDCFGGRSGSRWIDGDFGTSAAIPIWKRVG